VEKMKEDYSYNTAYHMRRIADTLEEILLLVKEIEERSRKPQAASLKPPSKRHN
jgi:hypothetical protein